MAGFFVTVGSRGRVALAVVTASTLLGCTGVESAPPDVVAPQTERPEGWTEETHGDGAEPDYAVVFPTGEVNRLDITIEPGNWQAMRDDLTQMLGEFGSSGGGLEEIPPELFEACEGLDVGDPCEAFGGMVIGFCISIMGSELVCIPEDMQDEIPDPEGNLELVPGRPLFVPSTVTFGETTWWHVGIRFKGNSTLAYPWKLGIGKLPLRLDFDEFEDQYPEIDDQRFFGFKHLSLANNFNDPSYLREKVAADLFRDAGVPAPHTAFYRVYIDYGEGPVYFGLYTASDVPGKPMLDAQLGGAGGNLYKASGEGATWAVFDPDSFDPKTNESQVDYQDLEAVFDALHAPRTDAGSWREGLELVFDVDGFLLWLATNTTIQNWDSYGNTAQNYYLYADPADGGRVTWIPWDLNESLKAQGALLNPLSLELDEVDEAWPLIRFLMDDPQYWEVYVSHVADVLDTVFVVEPTQLRYRSEYELIAPFVVGADAEQADFTFVLQFGDFETAVDDLIEHVEVRDEEVRLFLDEG